MKIVLNGHKKDISVNTLSALAQQLCPNPKHVIAEVNGTIIAREQWETTSITHGDTIELVTFVGGG